VTNVPLAKVAYARASRGTTIYYVDSTVWNGGAPITANLFRALQQAYPDSLFSPEESNRGTMAVAMSYATPGGPLPSPHAPVTWRYLYPTGAQVTSMANCAGNSSCWSVYAANFEIGQIYPQDPAKVRVYFASAANNTASSTTYCENGGWTGTNSCTLNLAGLTVSQVRYYDFEDNLVEEARMGPL